MEIGWITGPAEVLDKEHWEGLSGTPFQSHSWLETWWRVYGRNSNLVGLKVTDGKEPVAYWPLVRSRGLCRTLTPLGVTGSDYLPPLVRPDIDPWPILMEALQSAPDADTLNLKRLREDQTPLPLIPESTCLSIALPSTFEEYEKGLGKSLKADIRRGSKLKITEDDDNIELLFFLHRKRWKDRGWPGAFHSKAQKFHRNIHTDRSVYVIWSDGEPIGALYALEDDNTTYFYQSGFDPQYSNLSPGTVLIAHAIRQAIEKGHTHFDFLRGDEPYKRRWKPTESFAGGSYIEGLTPVGVAKASWLRLAGRVELAARARFEGKSLLSKSSSNRVPKS